VNIATYIQAVATIGPGGEHWHAWAALLREEVAYVPRATTIHMPPVLPTAERRRTGASVRLALACGLQALESAGEVAAHLATVFCSSEGDGDNCHHICETLASSQRLLSPTRFHNSVHNAPSGYWGIASTAMLPSTSLCAYDASFAVGLLEAAVQAHMEQRPVLLVVYDTPYPEPLHATRPLVDAFAVALLLRPHATPHHLGGITLAVADTTPTTLPHPALEALRSGIPAARSLPLLHALAHRQAATLFLEYVNGRSLHVVYIP